MNSSRDIIESVLFDISLGKTFTEGEALVKLLEISSKQFDEGTYLSSEELKQKLRSELECYYVYSH